jgi:hypothetical protein
VKLKALVALIALGLAGASLAYAAPKAVSTNPHTSTGTTTHGKKPPKTGPGCKPQVAVILKGTLGGLPVSATPLPWSVQVTRTGGNHASKNYTSVPVLVTIDTSTKINRQGHHLATDLQNGDRVLVHARVCKADLANGGQPSLTATRVVAHPPKS